MKKIVEAPVVFKERLPMYEGQRWEERPLREGEFFEERRMREFPAEKEQLRREGYLRDRERERFYSDRRKEGFYSDRQKDTEFEGDLARLKAMKLGSKGQGEEVVTTTTTTAGVPGTTTVSQPTFTRAL